MSILSYQEMVDGLVAQRVPRDQAEARARELCGTPAPDPATLAQAHRDAAALEKTEQVEVRKRFVACGFGVYNLSQARAAKQTPGLPDLWLVHRALPIALWWETKRQVGGVHSPAQRGFAAECDRCGVNHGTGDRYDAERWLIEHELAGVVAGVFEPVWQSVEQR